MNVAVADVWLVIGLVFYIYVYFQILDFVIYYTSLTWSETKLKLNNLILNNNYDFMYFFQATAILLQKPGGVVQVSENTYNKLIVPLTHLIQIA